MPEGCCKNRARHFREPFWPITLTNQRHRSSEQSSSARRQEYRSDNCYTNSAKSKAAMDESPKSTNQQSSWHALDCSRSSFKAPTSARQSTTKSLAHPCGRVSKHKDRRGADATSLGNSHRQAMARQQRQSAILATALQDRPRNQRSSTSSLARPRVEKSIKNIRSFIKFLLNQKL